MRVPVVQRAESTRVTLDEYARTHRAGLLAHALLHGAVLLRGWTPGVREFAALPDALGLDEFAYVGGAAPRSAVYGNVLTANDAPPTATIPFHHELAQARARPSHLLFACETPAARGGRTEITDSRALAEYVATTHPRVAARLDDGVTYERVLPPVDDKWSPIGRSWRSTFQCHTPAEAERAMAEAGMEWEWRGDLLWTRSPVLPAFRHEPKRGARTFYNSILAAHLGWSDARNYGPHSVRFADGGRIPSAFVDDVYRAAHREAYRVRWRVGDVLLVDNSVAMHARETFSGARRLWTLLVSERDGDDDDSGRQLDDSSLLKTAP